MLWRAPTLYFKECLWVGGNFGCNEILQTDGSLLCLSILHVRTVYPSACCGVLLRSSNQKTSKCSFKWLNNTHELQQKNAAHHAEKKGNFTNFTHQSLFTTRVLPHMWKKKVFLSLLPPEEASKIIISLKSALVGAEDYRKLKTLGVFSA